MKTFSKELYFSVTQPEKLQFKEFSRPSLDFLLGDNHHLDAVVPRQSRSGQLRLICIKPVQRNFDTVQFPPVEQRLDRPVGTAAERLKSCVSD